MAVTGVNLNQSPIQCRVYEYDFAVDGGATTAGTEMRGAVGEVAGRSGGVIPAGAVVLASITKVVTDMTGNSANTDFSVTTPSLATNTALDAVDPATLDAGEVFLEMAASGAITELAADAKPEFVIATDTVTAGKVQHFVYFTLPLSR